MRQDSIWLATASLYSTNAALPDDESSFTRVIIKKSECITYLTPALQDPTLLLFSKTFVADHLSSIIVHDTDDFTICSKQALCFGKSLSRSAAFVWFGGATAISSAISLAFALVAHDMGTGLAVGGFLLAILGAVLCLVLYQQSFAPE